MFDWSDEEAMSSLIMPVSSLHLHNDYTNVENKSEQKKGSNRSDTYFETDSVRSSVDMEVQSANKFVANIKNYFKTMNDNKNDSDSNEGEVSLTRYDSFDKIKSNNSNINEKPLANTPKQAVESMILGRPYCLDIFCSLTEKYALISAASASFNSTVTIKVVLFLKNTLNSDLFYKMLNQYSFALNEYKAFLKQTDAHYELKHLQKNLNLLDYFQYKFEKIQKKNHLEISHKIALLEKLLSNKLFKDEVDKNSTNEIFLFSTYTREYINLLKNQICLFGPQKILVDEFERKQTNYPLIKNNPNFWFSLDDSVMKTAKYAVFQQIQNRPLLPEPLKAEYNLNDKQFEWLVLVCFVAMGYYSSVSTIFNRAEANFFKRNSLLQKINTTFKETKLTSFVGFEHVACYLNDVNNFLKEIYFESQIDEQQICSYINAIPNSHIRMYIAEHCEKFDILVDLIAQTREINLLRQKMAYIKNEKFVNLANAAINSKNTKWK